MRRVACAHVGVAVLLLVSGCFNPDLPSGDDTEGGDESGATADTRAAASESGDTGRLDTTGPGVLDTGEGTTGVLDTGGSTRGGESTDAGSTSFGDTTDGGSTDAATTDGTTTGEPAAPGQSDSQLVGAGQRMSSAAYDLVLTLGQPTQTQSTHASANYRLQGGLIGANGSPP
ncbi:MAG: hypothetical protein AAF721_38695 [Myxococcota bacterium]